ncbi:MAG: hypothetical protein Greene041662_470 [Candidatus Peregrinibacteria bacterium Greene0416_62]|nr:MAG: hypothetical protein Greene041662_470 [Candidatus Peregrinibacteria bacterium Greene0416_62]TSC99984.1 MAG: hypothetical protein Greene101449_424 [Candidatus Peregrinibacteria bacterium Greene1014_49]
MRLKVSPKAALGTIDTLIYEGFELQMEYGSNLKDDHSAIIVAEEDLKKISAWHDKTVEGLRDIFLDFAPVYFFWKAIDDAKVEEKEIPIDSFRIGLPEHNYKYYAQILDGGLRILGEYYRQLSEQVFTPLFYIPDKAQLCFFASICPIEPDSNEDAVCRFLFKRYSYHEWVEMEDIFVGAFGGNKDEYSGKDKTKIENAYDGVNRKTNEAFGFPILKKRKTLIALNLPSRFLREERREMAS